MCADSTHGGSDAGSGTVSGSVHASWLLPMNFINEAALNLSPKGLGSVPSTSADELSLIHWDISSSSPWEFFFFGGFHELFAQADLKSQF
jgi:hypothetical protein